MKFRMKFWIYIKLKQPKSKPIFTSDLSWKSWRRMNIIIKFSFWKNEWKPTFEIWIKKEIQLSKNSDNRFPGWFYLEFGQFHAIHQIKIRKIFVFIIFISTFDFSPLLKLINACFWAPHYRNTIVRFPKCDFFLVFYFQFSYSLLSRMEFIPWQMKMVSSQITHL